jgi:hypothetical protein
MESGAVDDYGLNADNTPLYIWAAWHHWQMHADQAFRDNFQPSVRAAADHLVRETGPDGLLNGIPAGTAMKGITSWRNIIPRYVLAGQVTEINALSAMALRKAAGFCADPEYAHTADRITEAVNSRLWNNDAYLLNIDHGIPNPQVTGDQVFPLFTGVAREEQAQVVLQRLARPDFWTPRACAPCRPPTRRSAYLSPPLAVWLAAGNHIQSAFRNRSAGGHAGEIVELDSGFADIKIDCDFLPHFCLSKWGR